MGRHTTVDTGLRIGYQAKFEFDMFEIGPSLTELTDVTRSIDSITYKLLKKDQYESVENAEVRYDITLRPEVNPEMFNRLTQSEKFRFRVFLKNSSAIYVGYIDGKDDFGWIISHIEDVQ